MNPSHERAPHILEFGFHLREAALKQQSTMVRGVAKAQAQAKSQKKAEGMNKHGSQLEDQKKGLKLICPACKVGLIARLTVRLRAGAVCVLSLASAAGTLQRASSARCHGA